MGKLAIDIGKAGTIKSEIINEHFTNEVFIIWYSDLTKIFCTVHSIVPAHVFSFTEC